MHFTVVETGLRDNYPVHIYMQKVGPDGRLSGPRDRVHSGHLDSQEQAFNEGFAWAQTDIDQRDMFAP